MGLNLTKEDAEEIESRLEELTEERILIIFSTSPGEERTAAFSEIKSREFNGKLWLLQYHYPHEKNWKTYGELYQGENPPSRGPFRWESPGGRVYEWRAIPLSMTLKIGPFPDSLRIPTPLALNNTGYSDGFAL